MDQIIPYILHNLCSLFFSEYFLSYREETMARRNEPMEKTPPKEEATSVGHILKLVQGLKLQSEENPALM
jgi:hypothetical protein